MTISAINFKSITPNNSSWKISKKYLYKKREEC